MFSPARLALFDFSACLLNLNKSVMASMLTPLPKRRVICRQIKGWSHASRLSYRALLRASLFFCSENERCAVLCR